MFSRLTLCSKFNSDFESRKNHPSVQFPNIHSKALCLILYSWCCCKLHKSKGVPNRPGVAQRVPGGLGSRISWHSAREGGEVVSLTHRPPLPSGMFLVLIFTRGWVDPGNMVGSEGNMSLKNPVTPPGIDPGTVRLVAQRPNHYATPGPAANFILEQSSEKVNNF